MKDFVLLFPELFLVLTVVMIIAAEATSGGEKRRLTFLLATIGLLGAFLQALATYRFGASAIFGGALYIDGFSLFFKLFFFALAAFALSGAFSAPEIRSEKRAEYVALVLGCTIAMSLSASAGDLLLVFLSLQLMNILVYFLAGFREGSLPSTEAAVKHMVFSALSAAFFLYGSAVLFSHTQTLNMYEIHEVLIQRPLPVESAHVIFALMFAALAFPMAVFPMNLASVDVFEGTPTPSASFVAIGTRAAGFAVALRFFTVIFARPGDSAGQWLALEGMRWTEIVGIIASITILFGSLAALRQNRVRRLMAYLIVAQSGFLLIGLLVLDEVGLSALLYGLTVELFSLVGFYLLLSRFCDLRGSDELSSLKGILNERTPESIGLILLGACYVGLPPLPGFIARFALVGAAVRHEWHFLAVMAILGMTVGILAIIKLAYSLLGDARHAQVERAAAPDIVPRLMWMFLLPILFIGVFAELVLSWTGQSLKFIFW